MMEITIFSKKRKTVEGRSFDSFLGKLEKKDGTSITVSVKFKQDADQPRGEDCPMNIKFEKSWGNLASREYLNDEGEIVTAYTLWLSKWEKGSDYVDHSLDEFF